MLPLPPPRLIVDVFDLVSMQLWLRCVLSSEHPSPAKQKKEEELRRHDCEIGIPLFREIRIWTSGRLDYARVLLTEMISTVRPS